MLTPLKKITLFIISLFLSTWLYADPISSISSKNFKLKEIVNGLNVPWGMSFLSVEKLIFTQRNGKIGSINLKTNSISWIKNTPTIHHHGQAGLLDVAYPQHDNEEQWIYFTYSKKTGNKSATTLSRAKLENDRLINWQELIESQSQEDTNYHYGSRITFDHDGHVFFSIGDRGVRPNGQNLLNHAGSILRLNRDGSIPKDNPFVGRNDVLPEIWSYGHRNPQGLFYDKVTDKLWSIEHGPRGGDEINLIEAGNNYGWPIISYGKEYWGPISVGEGTHKKGMQQPVKTYIPSIAPSSLIIYSGQLFSQWKGNLFAGALKLKHLNRVVINDSSKAVSEERLLEKLEQRIRCVAESPSGEIYFSTDMGQIIKLTLVDSQ